MKKIYITIIFSLLALSNIAQNTNEHMLFKGIPINGTLESFIEKMQEKDFTLINKNNSSAMMEGTFAGYNDCKIFINPSIITKQITNILVIFPPNRTWTFTNYTYEHLKQMLTKKYGEPSLCNEKFLTNTQPTNDEEKFKALTKQKCFYTTFFNTELGFINLEISYDDAIGAFTKLIYIDSANFSGENSPNSIDDL